MSFFASPSLYYPTPSPSPSASCPPSPPVNKMKLGLLLKQVESSLDSEDSDSGKLSKRKHKSGQPLPSAKRVFNQNERIKQGKPPQPSV